MNSLSLRDGFGLFSRVLPCAHAADHEENEEKKERKTEKNRDTSRWATAILEIDEEIASADKCLSRR